MVKEIEVGLSEVSVAPVQSRGINRNRHWKVPFFPCASFTGRTALLQRMLDYFMSFASENQRRFAIHGLGGAGKCRAYHWQDLTHF